VAPRELRSNASPYRQAWNWVQFVCAFVFVGVVAFLHVDPPLDGLAIHLVKTLLIASTCACLAGRFGDSVWRGIVTFLRFL
jgi:hypothetical protein